MSGLNDEVPTIEKDMEQNTKEIEAVEKKSEDLFDALIEPSHGTEKDDQQEG